MYASACKQYELDARAPPYNSHEGNAEGHTKHAKLGKPKSNSRDVCLFDALFRRAVKLVPIPVGGGSSELMSDSSVNRKEGRERERTE